MYASVPGRRSVKEDMKSKCKALSWVRRRLEKLQEENERLAYQHQLVAELCEGFDWFRHMQLHALQPDPELMLADNASRQLTPANMQQQFTTLLQTEAEVQLLQQLSSLSVTQQSSSNSSAALVAAADNSRQDGNTSSPASSCQLVAPPGDAMWLLKRAFQQPWPQDCPSIDKVTVPALVEHFRATVHALSLQLVQLDACEGAAAQAEPLRKVQTVLLQHLRVIVELCSSSHGRHLLATVYLTNLKTGEQLSEPDMQRIAWVTDSLQLSKQQQRNIAQGSVLAQKLLTPLLNELRELQLQQGSGCTSPDDGSCGKTAGEAAQTGKYNASASSGSNAAAAAAAVAVPDEGGAAPAGQDTAYAVERMQSLLQQQQRSARMKLLMGKAASLRACFASYLYGQLTWVQLARLFVLMFPCYPIAIFILGAVAAQVAREQQQQQQRRRQARADSPDAYD